MTGNEQATMIKTGGDITVLGMLTIIQYKVNPKNQRVLKWAAWSLVIIGIIMWVVYELGSYLLSV